MMMMMMMMFVSLLTVIHSECTCHDAKDCEPIRTPLPSVEIFGMLSHTTTTNRTESTLDLWRLFTTYSNV